MLMFDNIFKDIEKFTKSSFVNFLAITLTIIVSVFPNIAFLFKVGLIIITILICSKAIRNLLKSFIISIYNFFSIKIVFILVIGFVLGIISSTTFLLPLSNFVLSIFKPDIEVNTKYYRIHNNSPVVSYAGYEIQFKKPIFIFHRFLIEKSINIEPEIELDCKWINSQKLIIESDEYFDDVDIHEFKPGQTYKITIDASYVKSPEKFILKILDD
jgi:hypothetical protein